MCTADLRCATRHSPGGRSSSEYRRPSIQWVPGNSRPNATALPTLRGRQSQQVTALWPSRMHMRNATCACPDRTTSCRITISARGRPNVSPSASQSIARSSMAPASDVVGRVRLGVTGRSRPAASSRSPGPWWCDNLSPRSHRRIPLDSNPAGCYFEAVGTHLHFIKGTEHVCTI